MTEFGTLLLTIGALSLTVTKVVDLIRNLIDAQATYPKWIWNVAALVVGLAFALGWEVNVAAQIVVLIPALAGEASRVAGVSGQILTGFIIGMSAGFWHELLSALSSIQTKNEAAVVVTTEPTF